MSLYSLQKQYGMEELHNLPEGMHVYNFGPDFDEDNGCFMDTAAVMKNLDLVISVDTAIVHLAGALGVPIWVFIPFVPEWRWLHERSDSPWYPTMRLFRQTKRGDWESVIKNMVCELDQLVQQRSNAMFAAFDTLELLLNG